MKSRMESKISSPVVIGVDIGKEAFHLVGFTADRKIAFRRRIRAGIAGSHPDLTPGPALRHDRSQGRCLQSMHSAAQRISVAAGNSCRQ